MTYMLLVENLQGNPRKFYRDIPANSTGKPFELLLHKIFILSFALLRPYYIANRTREILISNIHLLSPQKWSLFVDFDIEKEFPREQP